MGHNLILSHRKESEETTSKLDKLVKKMERDSVEVESVLATEDPASEYNLFRRRN